MSGIGITFIVKTAISHYLSRDIEKHKSALMKINDTYRSDLMKVNDEHRSDLMKLNDVYRKELNSEIEQLKHEQQRVFKDFELYTTKKHERYPELFKYLETAYGAIFTLRGVVRELTFENTNKADIEWFLTEEVQATGKDKQEILNLWDQEGQRNLAIQKLNIVKRRVRYHDANQKWVEANDFFIFNQLFLSDEVAQQCREFLNDLWEYLEGLDPSFAYDPDIASMNQELREIILPAEREAIKTLMKSELTVPFSTA
ncbi:hypothetical protein [Bacillus sp. FJAT-51639]|uniref:hypothetical protein n=1 Tax=Bacillus bruguierae TaxID=3127667 RepID=UPI00301358FD